MSKASELIQKLQLIPHPEGGHYREIYRSGLSLLFEGRNRAALTSIYFLLEEGEVSRWHRVDAEEAWHFYEGDALELFVMPPDFSSMKIVKLGEVSSGNEPVYVIPAGWWQAARSSGSYSLCGCTVAPGFEFSGFRFLDENEKETVSEKHPALDLLL
jgi:hypothetical protein